MNTLNLSDNAAELAHLKLRVAQLTSTLEEISNTTWGGDCRSKAKAELQRQPTSLPTFFMGTDGTVCTHSQSDTDIPVWCANGSQGMQVMNIVTGMTTELAAYESQAQQMLSKIQEHKDEH